MGHGMGHVVFFTNKLGTSRFSPPLPVGVWLIFGIGAYLQWGPTLIAMASAYRLIHGNPVFDRYSHSPIPRTTQSSDSAM
ncbi:uncharacterized protein EAE98_001730 [Botrytis deweyae]|uniref:Uncharacterized protein n=1 Tax=Botrytis deweyae TaxID=2478750 RepID=A0ABQ7IYP3_9HELO|nr:uncharacterized protein EAE98_001730 [Botrytis deweyae]KAF7937416.1 hypothetical protein EAE98_001730 [Botrytis deweyae]